MKEYNFKDNFEMVYLRHEYLSKIPNPDSIDIEKFKDMALATGAIMYRKFSNIFRRVGFDEDDVKSVAKVYLLAFMGLYSFDSNEKTLNRFKEQYRLKNDGNEPSEEELTRVDRNNLITFLRQKLAHCAVVCERKSRNIIANKDISGAFAYTTDSKPASPEEILKDYKKYSYRKVTKKELKEIKLQAKKDSVKELSDKNGFGIIEVNIKAPDFGLINEFDTEADFTYTTSTNSRYGKLYGENKNVFNNSPEESYMHIESDVALKGFRKDFFNLTHKEKCRKLDFFIRKHKGDKKYKEELKLAKKFLQHFKKRGKI